MTPADPHLGVAMYANIHLEVYYIGTRVTLAHVRTIRTIIKYLPLRGEILRNVSQLSPCGRYHNAQDRNK